MPRLTLLAACLLVTPSLAGDWPQWMGPQRDGLCQETGLLQAWPEAGPTRQWMFTEAGKGYSGPAVVDGYLYFMGSRDGVAQLIKLNAASGDLVWAIDLADEYTNDWGDGPRGTPTIDSGRAYCLTGNGTLACVETNSGEKVWSVRMQDFGGGVPVWGFAESPLVDGGRVIVGCGGDQGAIVALDRETGDPLWQSKEVTGAVHYSSTIAAELSGKKQYVRLLEKSLVGVDAKSGERLWQVDWPGRVAVIPTPLVKDNRVYVTSGYGVGCMLVEIAEDNTATVVYDNKTMKNHHGGALLLEGRVYGHSDGVGWVCQDFASGELVWRERSALGKGAIAHADGRFYCLGEDDGQVVLIAATPEGWQEHGRFTLDPQTKIRSDKGKVWTHPVIANGKLYLRDQDHVYCYDVAAE